MTPRESAHIPWAFSIGEEARFPLIGEGHPLRLEKGRWLFRANLAAMALGLVLFGAWEFWKHRQPAEAPPHEVRIVRYSDLGVPPSINQQVRAAVPKVEIARAVAPPTIAVPEPVPDEEADVQTIATVEEMEEAQPTAIEDLGEGGGDSLIIEAPPGNVTPGPEEFIVVDEEPVRIRIDPPVYPEMARDAQVEGTVIVRALVGKDGKIKDTIIIDGNPLLNEAALASAKSAVFRPALVRKEPVEVWVMIPVTFQLR